MMRLTTELLDFRKQKAEKWYCRSVRVMLNFAMKYSWSSKTWQSASSSIIISLQRRKKLSYTDKVQLEKYCLTCFPML
ncbi:hypothetical protein CS542_06405 [Pedobacter sp. IW39]|nr:hypothetical protein CS542_06405 [Pedobacter sp. IW39]